MSFKRLHQKRFDCQHDGDEGESIGQDARDIDLTTTRAGSTSWPTADPRVFEERRKMINFVCEVPVVIGQRLFALARAILQSLE